jgi:8-oxo-dGTP pyrophosphatase MutT (NUDIX family)
MDDGLVWERVGSEAGPTIPLFRIRFDLMRHPGSSQTFRRLVLESADWVNVVAVTKDRRIVMVTQYRFGIGELTTEPVAGIVDAGENSVDAAKRELLEETGFGAGRWRYLGGVQANPAFQNNLCHHWLAEDVVPLQSPSPDAGDDPRRSHDAE